MRQEGLDAARDTTAALKDIRTVMLEIGILNMQQSMENNFGAIGRLFGALGQLNTQFLSGIPWIGQWLSSVSQIPVVGAIASLALLGLASQLVIVASSFLIIGAGAVVMVATAVAGFAAIGAAALGALGPIGLLAGAVIFLGDRMFSTGKTSVDPLLGFENALGKMADTWGARAFPMAVQMMDFFTKLVPMVTSAGLQILDWFGKQLPPVLQFLNANINALGDAWNTAWPKVAGFMSELFARLPAMAPIFKDALGAAGQAVQGLGDNFLRFVDWFIKEWPKLKPIVQEVMEQAGKFIQWLIGEAKKAVDWFVANWPQIAKTAQDLKPVLDVVAMAVDNLGRVFKLLLDQTDNIVAGLGKIGPAFSALGSAARAAQVDVGNLLIALSRIPGANFIAGQNLSALGQSIIASTIPSAGSVPFPAGGGASPPPATYIGPIGGSSGSSLPTYGVGGTVPGATGAPRLAVVHGGEKITPAYPGRGGGSMDDSRLLAQAVALLQVIAANSGRGPSLTGLLTTT